MAGDRTVKVTLTAQVNNYIAGMEQARKSTESGSKASQDAAKKYEEQNQAMTKAGATLMATGAVALTATALAVKAAIDWETAWAGVTKTVSGTPEQLAEMEVGLRNLAKELPATHQEIAAVAEAAGQLGVKREGVLAFTRTMVDLANTTNLTADEAATSIAQLMNVMQTAPDEVDNLGAALVALGNNGASTERDIIQMAQRIAGAGKIVGLTEAEVLGFANALASVGIEAEAGGSAISRIMTDMAMAVSAGGEDLTNFAAVAGMSGADFAKAFKDAPAEAIATFVEGLGGIDAAGGDVFKTLDDLGQSDIRVSQALLGMANSGDMLRESLELGSKAWDDNTALAAEAEKRYETTASKLQVMANNVNDAAITFGDVFLPAVNGAAEAVGALASGFGALPVPMQQVTAVVVALAAATALGGGAFLLAIPKIAEYRAALLVLSTSSIPAVAAATTGLMTVTSNTAAGLAATAKFLTGPFGVALAAAGVSVKLLSDYIETLKTTTAEWQNVIANADSARELFAAEDQGRLVSQLKQATKSAEDFQYHLDLIANNDFARGFSLAATQMKTSLAGIGERLAKTAETDLPAAQRAFGLLADQTDGSNEQLRDLLDTMPAFEEALVAQANALEVDLTGLSETERATALLKIAQSDGVAATEAATAATEALIAADEAAVEASEKWRAEIEEQDAAFVNLAGAYDAVIQKNQAVAQSAADATEDSGDSWQDFYDGVTVVFDDYLTELQTMVDAQNNWESNMIILSGRVSEGMLDELARLGPEGAPLVAALTAASDEELAKLEPLYAEKAANATGAFAVTLANSQAIIAAASAQLGEEAADEIAEKLANGTSTVEEIMRDYKLEIESSNPIVTVGTNVATAQQNLDNFIQRNNGRTITLTSKVQNAPVATIQANGSVLDFFANGGMRENHVAQIAPAGSWRVWAEDETGGEAYIPLAASKRARSLQIWQETGNRLGVAGFANGYVTPQYASSSSSSGPASFNVVVSSKGGVDLLKYVDVRVEQTGIQGREVKRGRQKDY